MRFVFKTRTLLILLLLIFISQTYTYSNRYELLGYQPTTINNEKYYVHPYIKVNDTKHTILVVEYIHPRLNTQGLGYILKHDKQTYFTTRLSELDYCNLCNINITNLSNKLKDKTFTFKNTKETMFVIIYYVQNLAVLFISLYLSIKYFRRFLNGTHINNKNREQGF